MLLGFRRLGTVLDCWQQLYWAEYWGLVRELEGTGLTEYWELLREARPLWNYDNQIGDGPHTHRDKTVRFCGKTYDVLSLSTLEIFTTYESNRQKHLHRINRIMKLHRNHRDSPTRTTPFTQFKHAPARVLCFSVFMWIWCRKRNCRKFKKTFYTRRNVFLQRF